MTDGLPPIDASAEPLSVQHGSAADKRTYQSALAFEQMLVTELAQQLAATASTPSDDGSDGSSGLMGSDPASSTYAQMLPQALSTSLMSSGGTGMALQLTQSLDPSLGAKP